MTAAAELCPHTQAALSGVPFEGGRLVNNREAAPWTGLIPALFLFFFVISVYEHCYK